MEPPVMVRPEADERPPIVETERPPAKVEVAVDVETMERTVVVPVMTALPVTDSGTPGVVLPMPTKPLVAETKS